MNNGTSTSTYCRLWDSITGTYQRGATVQLPVSNGNAAPSSNLLLKSNISKIDISKIKSFAIDNAVKRLSLTVKIDDNHQWLEKATIFYIRYLDKKYNIKPLKYDKSNITVKNIAPLYKNPDTMRVVYDNSSGIKIYHKGINSYVIINKVEDFIYSSNMHCRSTTIYFIGKNAYHDRKDYFNFCKAYYNKYIKEDNGSSTTVYVNRFSLNSHQDVNRKGGSVVVNGNLILTKPNKDKLNMFLEDWGNLSYKKIYANAGIAYKYGILLYGNPGTGKSSAVLHICDSIRSMSEWSPGIFMLDLSSSLEAIMESIDIVKECKNDMNINAPTIIIMEEIDIIMHSRDEHDKENAAKVSYLLQVLDGANTINNTIFIATTNYIDRLDRAFIRKSRFDMVLEVTDFETEDLAKEMCNGFKVPYTILEGIEYPINPTELQDKCINYLRDNIRNGLGNQLDLEE